MLLIFLGISDSADSRQQSKRGEINNNKKNSTIFSIFKQTSACTYDNNFA